MWIDDIRLSEQFLLTSIGCKGHLNFACRTMASSRKLRVSVHSELQRPQIDVLALQEKQTWWPVLQTVTGGIGTSRQIGHCRASSSDFLDGTSVISAVAKSVDLRLPPAPLTPLQNVNMKYINEMLAFFWIPDSGIGIISFQHVVLANLPVVGHGRLVVWLLRTANCRQISFSQDLRHSEHWKNVQFCDKDGPKRTGPIYDKTLSQKWTKMYRLSRHIWSEVDLNLPCFDHNWCQLAPYRIRWALLIESLSSYRFVHVMMSSMMRLLYIIFCY